MTDSLEGLTPEQLRNLQASDALVQSLMKDDATRKVVLRHIKKTNPAARVPEIEAEEEIEARLKEERDARKKLEADMAEQRARDMIRSKREDLVEKGLVAQGDIPSLEKFMQENELADYEKAAKLFKAARSAESVAHAPAASDGVLTMPDNKDLWNNPKQFARSEAFKAINEIRSGKAA